MKVTLSNEAIKQYKRLNEPLLSRINDAIDKLKHEPPEGDIRPIVGQPGYFRVKIGGYRILYQIKNNALFVTHIEPRGQAYKKKNRKR